jgi:hypothetical protein
MLHYFGGRTIAAMTGWAKLAVRGVVDVELAPVEAIDRRQGVGQVGRREPEVLGARQLHQAGLPVAEGQSVDIYEVSSGRPSEQREGLVGGQLLIPNGRTEGGLLERPQPGVIAEINLAALLAACHLESNESRGVNNAGDCHPGTPGGVLERRGQAIYGGGLATEEVEVVRLALDDPSHDERGSSSQSEARSFGKLRQKPGHLLLVGAQHRLGTRRRRSMWSAQA